MTNTLYFSQITNLENENSTLLIYKSEKERLEGETSELNDKIKKLQSNLAKNETKSNVINNLESTNNNTDANSELVQQIKEDSETAQAQVSLPSFDFYPFPDSVDFFCKHFFNPFSLIR